MVLSLCFPSCWNMKHSGVCAVSSFETEAHFLIADQQPGTEKYCSDGEKGSGSLLTKCAVNKSHPYATLRADASGIALYRVLSVDGESLLFHVLWAITEAQSAFFRAETMVNGLKCRLHRSPKMSAGWKA